MLIANSVLIDEISKEVNQNLDYGEALQRAMDLG